MRPAFCTGSGMDNAHECVARRVFAYTAAAGAALAAPAALQAALVLHPHLVSAEDGCALISFALAGTLVAVPSLLRALLSSGKSRVGVADT